MAYGPWNYGAVAGGFGAGCAGNYGMGGGFALIVVLFILLIIVGVSYVY